MPIYAYRCATCGHAKDVLQKVSDPVLSTCPACGAQTFSKQVTAAGFQLKGSGWYVTDFRGDNAARKADKADAEGTVPDKGDTGDKPLQADSAAVAKPSDAPAASAASPAPAPAAPSPSTSAAAGPAPAKPGTTPPAKG